MKPPAVPSGFDYILAINDLLERLTYEEIRQYLGYDSRSAITAILGGAIPSHIAGQALWVLYRDTFGKKPPMTVFQADGVQNQVQKAIEKT